VSRIFQRSVFVLSVTICLALISGMLLGLFGLLSVRAAGTQDGAYREMGAYGDVLKKIQTDYVTEPNMTDVTTGALHGLLESLDAESSYLTPAEYKIYKSRPTSGVAQVGIVVSKRAGYATIVSVAPGSPAEKEHLVDGDFIESVDDQSTHQLSLAIIRVLLDGKPGTPVTLSVVRAGKSDPEKITLTRAIAPVPALAEQQYENGSILYLKPGTLTVARVDEVAARIKTVGKGHKVLLDLRDSTGGDEAQGLRLANFFVQQGTLATLEGQKFPKQTFTADPAKVLTDAPIEVIVNRGTFGAAELTAAAIENSKRGDVIGERTFGEGSVQKTIELPDGAALLLTVAKYSGADGKKIQDEAVLPNILVGAVHEEEEDEDATPSAPAPKTDDVLTKAIAQLKAKNG
jgi:carboxyl-terminal processing protease